jgi:hypothetical protein
MALNPETFAKCAPSIATNIKQCGTVTLCNAVPLESGDLTSTYMSGSDYRVMEGLIGYDFEIKMCDTVQNGIYDFLMANKVNLSKRVQSKNVNSGLIDIAPFIEARQYSAINNEYWIVGGGQASGDNWEVQVNSSTNIPMDLRSFIVGQRVYIDGKSEGGSKTYTAWKIVSAVDNGDETATLILESQNANSNLDSDKLADPVSGILRRGTNNISDYEKFCSEAPAYLNWKNVPFWVETTRHSMCSSSNYRKWKKLMLDNNPLFREFGDLDDIQKNKQLAADFQKRWVNNVFFSKPLPYQSLATYNSLETIEAYDGSAYGLGVDGATCQGKRANVVGIIEQLAECDRIADLQGADLNLPNLFRTLYDIMRVRSSAGTGSAMSIDIFTDSVTAEYFNQGMIKYYNSKSDNTLRLTKSIDRQIKTAEFGFNYESYKLFWPQGLTINIITHFFFDDALTANKAVDQEDTARALWILDFSGIYPGILATNKITQTTGDLATLAKANADFACVMKVPTKEQTLMSMTYTVIVECPMANLILENFSDSIPTITDDRTSKYPATSGTTTTTTLHI